MTEHKQNHRVQHAGARKSQWLMGKGTPEPSHSASSRVQPWSPHAVPYRGVQSWHVMCGRHVPSFRSHQANLSSFPQKTAQPLRSITPCQFFLHQSCKACVQCCHAQCYHGFFNALGAGTDTVRTSVIISQPETRRDKAMQLLL